MPIQCNRIYAKINVQHTQQKLMPDLMLKCESLTSIAPLIFEEKFKLNECLWKDVFISNTLVALDLTNEKKQLTWC